MRAWATAPPIELSLIPTGVAGIGVTLDKMVELIRKYRTNPVIRQLAIDLTQKVPNKNFMCEAWCLWHFVRTYVRYVRDILDVETLQTPLRTLQNRAGDCDDHATLLGAMAESIGHPIRVVAMGFQPGSFVHVLAETRVGDRWIPMETTENVLFGWQPPRQVERMFRYA